MRIIYIIVACFVFYSCNTTEPNEDEDNIAPGKRNYTWSIDSVDYGNLPGSIELSSIWGSSPDDVWGAGFTTDVRNCLWHYDGQKWSRAVWNTPITEFGNGSKEVGGVWGFTKDDVWAFGVRIYSSTETTAPFIMHFDGSKWTEVTGDVSQMPVGFRDVFVINKDHFWISTSENVCEYKNGIWKKYFIGKNFIVQSVEGNGTDIYITAYPVGIDSLYLMKLDNNTFVTIDKTTSFTDGKFEHNGLLFTNDAAFTFGDAICKNKLLSGKIDIDSWHKELSVFNGGFRNSFKNNRKDIWGVGYPSVVYHFNGSNWHKYLLNESQQSTFQGIWSDGKEIFIGDIDSGTVFHGK